MVFEVLKYYWEGQKLTFWLDAHDAISAADKLALGGGLGVSLPSSPRNTDDASNLTLSSSSPSPVGGAGGGVLTVAGETWASPFGVSSLLSLLSFLVGVLAVVVLGVPEDGGGARFFFFFVLVSDIEGAGGESVVYDLLDVKNRETVIEDMDCLEGG